ncbi:MAG: hypothetical protein ACRESJ_13010 [Pseudomonas sp.]|uniref:hypothetical protein n=1 Tax=Pseudomonas sp. TaxID=306 RepID=UPI003D6E936C
MFDFLKLVMPYLPLHIECVEWDGDSLVVSGDRWSFVTSSAWRVSQGRELLFACWDDQKNIRTEELVGLSIVNMSWIAGDQPIDPSFVFSDGRRLDVFCTSVCEPWLMTLPDKNVYVGSA